MFLTEFVAHINPAVLSSRIVAVGRRNFASTGPCGYIEPEIKITFLTAA